MNVLIAGLLVVLLVGLLVGWFGRIQPQCVCHDQTLNFKQ